MHSSNDGTPATRVLVVDDHRTFTDLVRLALTAEPGLECVGAAHHAAQARAMVAEHRPDVVLMDVNLGSDDGLALTAELTAADPSLRVVVLTAHGDSEVMRRAATGGACALLLKDGSLPELLGAVRTARSGGLLVHPELLHTLVNGKPEKEAPEPSAWSPGLTPREQTVLDMLAEGRDVRAIARHLGISVNTCRGYVKTLLAKLGAHSQLEAVVIAASRGLVGGGSLR